jgi:predicted N-acetyltransferase YhbS
MDADFPFHLRVTRYIAPLPGANAHLQAEQQDVTNICPLETQKSHHIEALLDAAFGADRHGRTAYAIRHGMRWLPELSFALLDDNGDMAGLLQSWPIALQGDDGTSTPLIMVGPVAVLPERQGDGFGRALMDAMMAKARAINAAPLVMIGDPEYYGRFWGFSAQATGGWRVPGPVEQRRLLAVTLNAEALPHTGMLGPRVIAKA